MVCFTCIIYSLKKQCVGVVNTLSKYLWDMRRFGLTPDLVLRRMVPLRSDKILCISIPKSGTHLLERLICRCPGYYRKLIRTVRTGTLVKYGGLGHLLDGLKGGQIIFSHIKYSAEYIDDIKKRGVKTFFLFRDPRDVLISNTFYIMNNKSHELHPLLSSLKDTRARLKAQIIGGFQEGMYPLGDIMENFKGWLGEANLCVRYRDLIGHAGGGSDEAQEQIVSQILNVIEINENQQESTSLRHGMYSSVSPTFRKGTIGQWKDHFDDEIKELFKEKAGESLITYGYEADQNW